MVDDGKWCNICVCSLLPSVQVVPMCLVVWCLLLMQVSLSCLNSVAPPPLNWKMWCPDTHSNITEWVDEVGTTHRLIVLKPMRNMTARKAVWFMTPMFPEHLNVSGKVMPAVDQVLYIQPHNNIASAATQ